MPKMLAAQLRYQLTLILRNPRAFIFGLAMPALLLALQVGRQNVSQTTLTRATAGFVVFGVLSIAYLSYASSLVVAREDGVLRRWYAAPLPRWMHFAARIVATVLMADAAAMILLVTATKMARLQLTADAAGTLLVVATLGAVAVAAAGTAITPLLPTAQGAYAMLALTYLPLLVFSGGFGPEPGLPEWLTRTMTYLPVQPAVDAATRALQYSGTAIPGRDALVLGIWTLASLAVSVRFFRWDPTRPKHARKPVTTGRSDE